ncbi:GNAT family N-acetyltransferase [Undibacterium terreum]|uniref:N-acetyltransferase n=1 Tax=Undibacterium terreum TaxID=1224302 RepID=A0A916XJM4_9BURK|nr:GNAT family N-acetyltransferase [Undibacterium terreum]GGC76926.1 N-acetyltransferase [Undibacterium terreum]
MESSYKVALEAEPAPADMHTLVNGLTEFNAMQTGGQMPDYLLVSVRDSAGQLAGGLLGATYLGWLQIQIVWMPDSLRGQGYGQELMEAAEKEGLRRGCNKVFLETFSFQALPFYEKCGYKVFSRLADFPPGGARYALTKDLQPAA